MKTSSLRRGPWYRQYGLSLTLGILFLLSLFGQLITQWEHFVQEEATHNADASYTTFVWPFLAAVFENWQSEFLQLLTFVILAAFLYHRGSPQSGDGDEELQHKLNLVLSALQEMKERQNRVK